MQVQFAKGTNSFIKNKPLFDLMSLFLIQFILGILFISFFTVGFSEKPSSFELLSENAAILRSVGVFLVVWFGIVESFIIAKIDFKNEHWLITTCLCLSWTIVMIPFCIYYCVKKTSFAFFGFWLCNFFVVDEQQRLAYKRSSWKYIMMCALLVFVSQAIVVCLYKTTISNIDHYLVNNGVLQESPINTYTSVWFKSLQYLTIQTNLSCLLFLIIWVINPGFKIFKNNSLLMFLMVYIAMVGVLYNAMLLPGKISSGAINEWSSYNWYSTIIEHVLNPIAFVACGMTLLATNKLNDRAKLVNHMWYGSLFPIAYFIYASSASSIAPNPLYGSITNINTSLLTGPSLSTAGKPINIIYIVLLFLLIEGLVFGIYYLNNFFIKKNSSNN